MDKGRIKEFHAKRLDFLKNAKSLIKSREGVNIWEEKKKHLKICFGENNLKVRINISKNKSKRLA